MSQRWEGVLAPGRALMDRLTYPRKFVLVSVLFAAPLALTTGLLVSEIDERIEFARKEIDGNRYLRPLTRLQGQLWEVRVLGREAATRAGAWAAIEDDLAELGRLDRELGPRLGTTARLEALDAAWSAARAAPAEEALARAARLARELATHVGNASNLILDPDLDSYYLMDAVLLKLPAGGELVAQARALVRDGAAPSSPPSAGGTELIRLAGLIEAHREQVRSGLSIAFDNNPSGVLRPRLAGPAGEYDAALAVLLQAIHARGLVDRAPAAGTMPFDEAAHRAGRANKALWDRNVAELDGLLAARIDGFTARKRLILAFAAVLVLAAVYLWMAFHAGVMATIRRLQEASQRLLGATPGGEVRLEARDEMALVAASFNSIASRLRAEWEQAQEESQRARSAEAQLRGQEEQLVRARDAAEDASRAKSRFLANMSHELRTPLNAIIGYSEMLQEVCEEEGHEELVPDLRKIHTAGRHLLGLINDILDLSKVEAGRMTLYLETFDLGALLDEVTATIHPLVARNRNRLELDVPAGLGSMHADATKVRQCLYNLLSNACKFTEGGRVRLAVRRVGSGGAEAVRFEVSDDGPGMSEAEMENLFQAFAQADPSTQRKYGGTGLGLALTRRFCRAMGGDVAVASAPGQGATFTMWLPACVVERVARADEVASPPGEAAAAPAPGKDTILVIDDDADVRRLVSRHLQREGLNVVEAAGGEEGLRLARSLRPQAITLDVMMPGMDGWSVLTALKKDPELAAIPVLLCTVLDERNMGFALGATEFLVKPIDRDRLVAAVHRVRRGRTPFHVLLIEDEPESRERASRALVREGCTVDEAENGRAALAHVARALPDLIVLDLMMPEMNGFEFLQEFRRDEARRAVPVIVVTAKELGPEDHRRLEGHVQAVLRKGGQDAEQLLREAARMVRERLAAAEAADAGAEA